MSVAFVARRSLLVQTIQQKPSPGNKATEILSLSLAFVASANGPLSNRNHVASASVNKPLASILRLYSASLAVTQGSKSVPSDSVVVRTGSGEELFSHLISPPLLPAHAPCFQDAAAPNSNAKAQWCCTPRTSKRAICSFRGAACDSGYA